MTPRPQTELTGPIESKGYRDGQLQKPLNYQHNPYEGDGTDTECCYVEGWRKGLVDSLLEPLEETFTPLQKDALREMLDSLVGVLSKSWRNDY